MYSLRKPAPEAGAEILRRIFEIVLFAFLCSSLGQKPKRISHPDSELGSK